MNWKELYIESHRSNFQKKYPSAFKAGHWFSPAFPKYKTANGLSTLICNIMQWNGHHMERTNNMGRPVKKQMPKFNIMTGKVEMIDNGMEWQKGTGIKGTSDLKGHFKSSTHSFPIPVYLEIKIGKDRMSEHQKKYEKNITESGALYHVIKTPEDFFEFYNYLLSL